MPTPTWLPPITFRITSMSTSEIPALGADPHALLIQVTLTAEINDPLTGRSAGTQQLMFFEPAYASDLHVGQVYRCEYTLTAALPPPLYPDEWPERQPGHQSPASPSQPAPLKRLLSLLWPGRV